MILDKQLQMSAAQAVTDSAASTNVIDMGKYTSGDTGNSDDLFVLIKVNTAAQASGSATVTFAVQHDDDEAFGTVATLWTSAAIGKATLVGNYSVVRLKLPLDLKRYLRVYYTVATGPLTAGKFDAFVVRQVQNSH